MSTRIKFKNRIVPVEVIRKGSVVSIEHEGGDVDYFHIESFIGLGFKEDTMDLKISNDSGMYKDNSANIIWP